MKKLLLFLWFLTPAIAFAGCSQGDETKVEIPNAPEKPGDDDDDNNPDGDGGTVTPDNGKILIAYFSRWGNTNYDANVDATSGASIIINKGSRQGTTQIVADYIQAAVGGNVHLIETMNPYPVDFNEVRDQNHAEQNAQTLPALKSSIGNMSQYEVVFIGFPVWATDVPQAIISFLSAYNLSGKTVVPFCTHDGYGAGSSYRSVQSSASGANVLEGIAFNSNEVLSSETRIKAWLERIGIEREETQTPTIRITAGGNSFNGEWLDTPLAREIRTMFPLTANLGRYGGREYYGSMPSRPTETEEGQLHFENGDITYCPSNNTIAIFYAKADDPSMGTLTMRIIPIGKVTSNLRLFSEMESQLTFTFGDAH